jgi:aminoglycoside phosphotransferase (APT) family kinase protein
MPAALAGRLPLRCRNAFAVRRLSRPAVYSGGVPAAMSVGVVRDLVSAHVPGLTVADVIPCGEGLDNVAFDVNGELIVRFRKEPGVAERAALVTTEAALLDEIAGALPVAVPVTVFVDAERGCLAYRKLPGAPLLEQPRASRSAWAEVVGEVLGRSLAAMHALSAARMAAFVGTDDAPLTEWRADAADLYRNVAAGIPASDRAAIETFLADEPPPPVARLAFSHNDLGIEHVLVEPGTGAITGIIDWSDAAMVDPAYDVGLLYRDLGPAALDTLLRCGVGANDDGMRERAVFYARCGVLEDLAYGRETGRATYVDKSLAALDWLFKR